MDGVLLKRNGLNIVSKSFSKPRSLKSRSLKSRSLNLADMPMNQDKISDPDRCRNTAISDGLCYFVETFRTLESRMYTLCVQVHEISVMSLFLKRPTNVVSVIHMISLASKGHTPSKQSIFRCWSPFGQEGGAWPL